MRVIHVGIRAHSYTTEIVPLCGQASKFFAYTTQYSKGANCKKCLKKKANRGGSR